MHTGPGSARRPGPRCRDGRHPACRASRDRVHRHVDRPPPAVNAYAAATAPAPVLPIAQALAVELGCEPIVIAEDDRAAYAGRDRDGDRILAVDRPAGRGAAASGRHSTRRVPAGAGHSTIDHALADAGSAAPGLALPLRSTDDQHPRRGRTRLRSQSRSPDGARTAPISTIGALHDRPYRSHPSRTRSRRDRRGVDFRQSAAASSMPQVSRRTRECLTRTRPCCFIARCGRRVRADHGRTAAQRLEHHESHGRATSV